MGWHTCINDSFPEVHEIWRKFRDLTIDDEHEAQHKHYCEEICYLFMYEDTPEQAFDKLAEAVAWWNSL
jgi:hypothetical protein